MAWTKEGQKKLYNKRKKLGLCTRCGAKKKKSEKNAYCEECRKKYRKYGKKRSAETSKKRRKAYKLLKKEHKCTRCGKKLGKNYTKTRCKMCLDQAKIYEEKRRKKARQKK